MNKTENQNLDGGNRLTRKEIWQRTGLVIITIIIAVLMVWATTYKRSHKYFIEGEKFLSEGKLLDAVTSYETSAHSYTPWNSHVRRSLERMWEIGQRFENENPDPDYALIAYRSLRSSIYATRSFYTPYKEWIPKCDERIRALVRKQEERINAEKEASVLPTPSTTPAELR